MGERLTKTDRLMAVAAWLVPAVTAAASLASSPNHPLLVFGWAALMAIGQFVRLPAPSGGTMSLAFAVAAALPLVLRIDGSGQPDAYGAWAAIAIGLLFVWAVDRARGAAVRETAIMVLRRYVTLGVLLGGFLAWREVMLITDRLSMEVAEPFAIAMGGLLWFVTDTGLRAWATYRRERKPFRYLWLLSLSDWPGALSLFAAGALFGFAWPRMSGWALLLAGLPYAFSHLALLRYLDTRRTYLQTVRALSRIPEVAGLSPDGRADRVTDLALVVAQEVGMPPEKVAELEFAALMHDIGRITLNEPSILKRGFTDEDIARWGAEIIGEAPYLSGVSQLVSMQHQPYRRPGEERDPDLPLASKVIRVSSAYDHAVSDLGFSPLEALEVLHRGAAYDFDPEVVHGLRRVVERRGLIEPAVIR